MNFENSIYNHNAGIIILTPFLSTLFERCELMEHGKFHDLESKYRAVNLLEYAATGNTGKEEHELVINKILCGMAISDPLDRNIELSNNQKETVDGLLTSVLKQWTVLSNTSIDGLRETFLQRAGKLEENDDQYHLKVEQKSFDMLLDQIPWNINQINLSWMKKSLKTEWR